MAASEKVYVCGRCSDYAAVNLEELVNHMTNCGVPEIRKKDETNISSSPYEDEDNDVSMFDENSQYGLGGRTSPAPFLWSKKTGMILLALLKSHKDDMESPYIRKKTVWQKIAMEMQEKYGYSVSASQCENKFKNMCNRYRKAKDNNLNPENTVKHTCFLYDELDEYFRSDTYQPKTPLYVSKKPSPKIIRPSKSVDSDTEYVDREPMNSEPVNAEGESSTSFSNFAANETEPVWVKKMVETFERCHRENIKMQREFIDVLKRLVEKK